MRKTALIFFTFLSLSSTMDPSYAGKGKPEINVRNFTYTKLFNQKTIWKNHREVLETEGLGILVNLPNPEDESEDDSYELEHDKYGFDDHLSKSGGLAGNLKVHIKQQQQEIKQTALLHNNYVPLAQFKTTQDLDEALKADFLDKKRNAMMKILAINEIPACWDAGCVAFSYCTGIGGQFGVATAFGRLVGTAKEALRDLLIGGNDILSSEDDPLEPLELKYVTMKRFLDFRLQEKIEAMFTAARQNDAALDRALEEIPMFLNIPIHSKRPNNDFEEKIKELAAGYITEGERTLEDALLDFCTIHCNRYQEIHGINPKRKRILALVGEHGLGKSHIADELANILELNTFEASFAEGIKEFLGENKKPGALLRSVTNQKGEAELNAIAKLEELDRLLNEDKKAEGPALRILDPRAKELDLGYGMYDWSHHGQILLMNYSPKCEAILDRLDIVRIIGVKTENKKDILVKKILPEFLQTMLLEEEDLSQEELQEILSRTDKAGFRDQEEALQNLCAKKWREKRSANKLVKVTNVNNSDHDSFDNDF